MEIESERKEFLNQAGETFSFLQYPSATDKPALHFAHATGFNAYTYHQLFKLLSQDLSVYAMDARGHGFTTATADPNRFTSWDPYYRDLSNFAQDASSPIFLAGHSLGGSVSLHVAASHPQLVKGLILIEPVIPRGWISFMIRLLQLLRMSHKIPIAQKTMKRKTYFRSLEEAALYYEGRGVFSKCEKVWIENYLSGGIQQESDGCFALTCAPAWESKSFSMTNPNAWDNIENIQCPILLIYGGGSQTFHLSDATAFKKLHPATSIIHKQEASHFVPMEYPEEVAGLITRFCTANQ